ncbi:MAG: peptide-methionine (S)-S-oxide reductase MsrA [Parvularculales bacterium]
METATFAAGCFWGVESAFRRIPGVQDVEVGYTGGHTESPTYEQVCTGNTGHAEAIRVVFDPDRVSYDDLLSAFWMCHDPTTLNRQGPDVGSQYRSAIFTHTQEQADQAQTSKEDLASNGGLSSPPVTEITPAGQFWRAEEYHQRYEEKNSGRRLFGLL